MDLHMPVLDGFKAAKRLKYLEASGELDLGYTILVALSAMT